MSAAKPLPPCPLCKTSLRSDNTGAWHPSWVGLSGANDAPPRKTECSLVGVTLLAEAWRRLASPRLAPEIVAVLRAVDQDGTTMRTTHEAVKAWRAAGRPGLPPEGKEGGP